MLPRERRTRMSWIESGWAAIALLLTLALPSGCDDARNYSVMNSSLSTGDASSGDGSDAVDAPTAPTGTTAFPLVCSACHGSDDNPAPPRALPTLLSGKFQRPTATTARGVGAHQTHLRGTVSNHPIACESCHVVPSSIWDVSHLDAKDGRATVTFSGLALLGGATPTYDKETLTCSGVYCHGAKSKAPGPQSAPIWNVVDNSQRACSSCHGAYPPAPHPQVGDCVDCHGLTAAKDKTIGNKNNHINGRVDVFLTASVPCTGCHGAPPTTKNHPVSNLCEGCHAGTAGPGQTIAHPANHMNGKVEVLLSASAPCDGCHGAPPPATVKNHPQVANCDGCHAGTAGPNKTIAHPENHMNGKVEVDLSATAACDGCHGAPPATIAKTGAAHPQFQNCEGCHASTAGPNKTIAHPENHRNGKVEVLVVDGAPCNGCHGAPPATIAKTGAAHPQFKNCEGCHASTAGPNQTLAHPENHMNGKVEVLVVTGAPCNGCHGAPPEKIAKTGAAHPQFPNCEGCHAATVGANQSIAFPDKHMNGKVDVLVVNGAPCNGCHGFPPPQKHPKLTDQMKHCDVCHAKTVDATDKLLDVSAHMNGVTDFALAPTTCDACHGAPPQKAEHPPNVKQCQQCHGTTVGSDGKILAGGKHVNGTIDVVLPTKCDACHGGGGSAAPPPDHNGNTDPTLASVGAHLAHLVGNKYSKGGISCETCHVLPKKVDEPGHMFGTVNTVTFPNGLASWQGSVPSYDPVSHTCSNVYCHGATLPGGAATSPVWNMPGLACESCHATSNPGLGVLHPNLDPTLGTQACSVCHKGTVKPDGTIDTSTGYHVNGGLFQ